MIGRRIGGLGSAPELSNDSALEARRTDIRDLMTPFEEKMSRGGGAAIGGGGGSAGAGAGVNTGGCAGGVPSIGPFALAGPAAVRASIPAPAITLAALIASPFRASLRIFSASSKERNGPDPKAMKTSNKLD